MNDPTTHLKAAVGYLDLGMAQEAWDELDQLPILFRDRDAVLDLKIEIFQRLGNWGSARELAESLAKRSPENLSWWIHWAYSLRRETSVEAARDVLLEAAAIHPDAFLIQYNLACYSCVLGELESARKLLKVAISMNPHMKNVALKDPDLEAILREHDFRL